MTDTAAHKVTSERGSDCGMGDHMGSCRSCVNARPRCGIKQRMGLSPHCCSAAVNHLCVKCLSGNEVKMSELKEGVEDAYGLQLATCFLLYLL